jgi:hypothetical protein
MLPIRFLFFLCIAAMPAKADFIIQAMDTTPVYVNGSAGALLQTLNFDPSGVGGTPPSGSDTYVLSGGSQNGFTAHNFSLPAIPDGTYTVNFGYATSNMLAWSGGYDIQLKATTDAINSGRVTFVGSASSVLSCYHDDLGWTKETLIGTDNFLANMSGTAYSFIILNATQPGDLFLYLKDNDTASYSKICFDTLEFIGGGGVEPDDIQLLLWQGQFTPRDNFDIGVYYYGTGPPNENFDSDYGLMDVARNGGTSIIVDSSYNRGAKFWATAKSWGLKGIPTYGILNEAPQTESEMTNWILSNKNYWANLIWAGDVVGDNIIGYLIADEVECGNGMSTMDQDFLRMYCDLFKVLDTSRSIYINHCYHTGWYDLHEDQATTSLYPYGANDSQQIITGVATAQSLGLDSFVVVRQCDGHGYDNIYTQMVIAFQYGAKAFNTYTYVGGGDFQSLVDSNGDDNNYRMSAFGDAARDIRAYQGWPSITLARKISPINTSPLMDRRKYPAGDINLIAKPIQGNAPIQKVVFGKSINGGATWQSVEDSSYPYEITYSLNVGETVILRVKAVDTSGQSSICAANMIDVVDSSQLQCGDYESALLAGDMNQDCKVDVNDFNEIVSLWLQCDDPSKPTCNTPAPLSWFCGRPGTDYPGMLGDIDNDCDVDLIDFSLFQKTWHECDDPQPENCL